MKEALSKEESLALITEMIGHAKRNVAKGGSFYFLLWGWVITLANLGHYLIDRFDLFDPPYIVWVLVIPASIITSVRSARQSKEAKVTSHYDKIYGQLWWGIFTAIIVLLAFMAKLDFNHNAVILLFSALGTYISGCLLRFKPLIMGGFILLAGSIIAFNVEMIDQFLVASIALVIGYLVPGYLLKKSESEQV